MVATGTIRVDTEDRLIVVWSSLDGFTTTKDDTKWMVSPPYTSKQLPNRKLIVIGVADGPFEPEGIERGKAPMTDSWNIACGIVDTTTRDPQAAKRGIELAVNQLADELARSPRLGMAHGPRDLSITTVDGPYFAMDEKATPTAWANFDIQCFADIRRNP